MLRQPQIEVSRARGIDDAPALLLARAHLESRHDLAVDEHDVAFAAEQITEAAAAVGRPELAGLRQADVRQHQHELVAERGRVLRIGHNDRSVEAAADLRRRVAVRVIPVRPRVAQRDLVAKLRARFDGRLGDAGCAVHVVRHAQPVPVDRRRIRQRVLEVHDQAIADLRAQQGARNRAVVGPCGRRPAREKLDVGNLRLELDLEHVRIRVEVRDGRQRELGIPVFRLRHGARARRRRGRLAARRRVARPGGHGEHGTERDPHWFTPKNHPAPPALPAASASPGPLGGGRCKSASVTISVIGTSCACG